MSLRQSDIIAGVRLEDLQATATVRGILADALVTVVSARWFGSDALELIYRGAGGSWAARSSTAQTKHAWGLSSRDAPGASTATGSCFG